jgi:hypothetical protein
MKKPEAPTSNDSVQEKIQGIPSPKEKEKKDKNSSMVVKSLEGTKKIGKPWYVKEKVGRSAKVIKKGKYENHFFSNLINHGELYV